MSGRVEAVGNPLDAGWVGGAVVRRESLVNASTRVVVIGNPASGRGTGSARMTAVSESCATYGVKCTCMQSLAPGHAEELARSACSMGSDLVIAVGGDGTVRDVMAGLQGNQVPLGLVPAGTGNDLARTLGIPTDVERAVEIALSGHSRRLDVWLWNGVPFVNVAGVGMDAAVARVVNERFRFLTGAAAYVAGFLTVFPRYKPMRVRLKWESGAWEGSAWLVAVANGQYYGGGMRVAPAASPDDGYLSVIVVEGIPKIQLLGQFPRLFTGAHVKHPGVRCLQVRELSITGDTHVATIDGELLASTPAAIRMSAESCVFRTP